MLGKVLEFLKGKPKEQPKQAKKKTKAPTVKGKACPCKDPNCHVNQTQTEKSDGTLEFNDMTEFYKRFMEDANVLRSSYSIYEIANVLNQRYENTTILVNGVEKKNIKVVAINGGLMVQGDDM